FASGLAATTTAMHLFKTGDHIICGDDVYGGTNRLFQRVLKDFGLEFSFVDLTNPQAYKDAFRANTKAVWVETPTNPMLKVIDLEKTASIAREKGALTFCDNTFATPVFQQPLALGCDVVMHSSTKYLNGHSDVVSGVLCTSNHELAERLRFLQNAMGGIAGPWDSWLVLRG